MSTFSQVVDELVSELLRPDMRTTLGQYLQQTIRELHIDTKSGQVGRALKYTDNLVEETLTADSEKDFQWAIPKPHRFQLLESVWYSTRGLYSRLRTPSSAFMAREEINGDVYHYRSGNYLCFSGYGGLDAEIKLAYYQYPRILQYYAVGLRPATWSSLDEEYTYLPAYVTDEEKTEAVDLSTNWMLMRYEDLLKEGTRAKMYKRLNDPERGKLAFSAFESMKPLIISSETQEHSATYQQ